MKPKNLDLAGLFGSVVVTVTLMLSIIYGHTWWELTIGQELGYIRFSALNYEIKILDTYIGVPIIGFINIISQMLLIEGATALLIYSIMPSKSFSKRLLKFAYKKPLIILLFFIGILLTVSMLVPSVLLQTIIPIIGSRKISIKIENITADIPVEAEFTNTFWLMVISVILCLAAPIYHKKIISKPTEEAISKVEKDEVDPFKIKGKP